MDVARLLPCCWIGRLRKMTLAHLRIAVLFAVTVSPYLGGCSGPGVVECVGDLTVVARLAPVPEKLQIAWNGEVVVDECQDQNSGLILYEKRPTEVVINEGGFGYTPPATFDLVLNDLKDCVQAGAPLVSVAGHPVPGDRSSCSSATVTIGE